MTELMRRRRALMAAQGGSTPSLTLGDLTGGDGVKIGSAQFILIKGSSVAYMLREALIYTTKYQASATLPVDYDGSNIDTYLTTTFSNSLPSGISDYLYPSSVTYPMGASGATSTTNKTITRSIRVMTKANTSNNTWLNALKAYYNTTDSATALKAKYNGTVKAWWLMDAWTNGSSVECYTVLTNGTAGRKGATATDIYVRPLVILSLSTPVKIENDEYVLDV